ncbi:hypothetical protein E2986_00268, partial [Frieseomelitta varia]
DRKLTEPELKVQQSLQKLSIPDWYLNKYTSPPKLLKTKPFELRPSPWKNFSPQKKLTINSSTSSSSDVEKNLNEETQKATKMPIKITTCHQEELPSISFKQRTEDIFDIDIPVAKYLKQTSKTFPKRSPSRKFWNLNLVLPPGPKIDFSKEFESTYLDDGDNLYAKKLKTWKEQEKSWKQNDATEEDGQEENDMFRVPTAPIEPADTEFNVRATSTPNSSFVIPGPKVELKVGCDSTTEDFSTLQQDSINRAMNLLNIYKSIPKSRKLSPNILEKASIFESNSKLNSLDRSYARASSDKLLSKKNIRSNDSVRTKASIFESNSSIDNLNRSYTKPSSNKEKLLLPADIRAMKSVREKTFIYESNSSINSMGTSSLRRNNRSTKSIRAKMAVFESSVDSADQNYIKSSINKVKPLSAKNNRSTDSSMNNFDRSYAGTSSESLNFQSNDEYPPIPVCEVVRQLEVPRPPRNKVKKRNPDAVRSSINIEEKVFDKKLVDIRSREKRRKVDEKWSYTKFLGLEKNLARNKQWIHEGNTIQEIIRNFEKMRLSKSRRDRSSDSFVKQVANALEKEDISAIKKMMHQNEEDDCTESGTTSYVTSTFQDTDTSLDSYDQRPSTSKCDEGMQRYDSGSVTMGNLTVEKKTKQEGDDFVYWIPIYKRKLPRSSSLLSIISKLSSNCCSPLISPIKSEDEHSQWTRCETSGKSNIGKKLFKIDETVVIDSGYSDKSVLNSVSSTADNICYNDIEFERKSTNRRKWSPKPLSIAGRIYGVP